MVPSWAVVLTMITVVPTFSSIAELELQPETGRLSTATEAIVAVDSARVGVTVILRTEFATEAV